MSRDDESFTEFVTLFSPALLRTAYLLTGDRGHAEDLLQTALLKVSRRWWRLDNPMKAYAYVRTTLVNSHISALRRRRVAERLIDTPMDLGWAPHEHFTPADRTTAALAALPAGMRAVLVLRFHEDLSEAETARALGCSVGNVKSQTSRGLERLRRQLADDPTPPDTSAASRSADTCSPRGQ
jgi:RNA polymerase sigma-70 factor (sigma-E family)